MKPIHKHDCDKCKFIGIVNTNAGLSDLYYNCSTFGSIFIIRHGKDGDYVTTNNLEIYLQPIED